MQKTWEKLKEQVLTSEKKSKVIKLKHYDFFAWTCYVRFILNVCMSEILKPQWGRVRERQI